MFGGSLVRFTFCAVGICFSYISYGLLMERLFSGPNHLGPTFILVTQCITNTIVAYCCWPFLRTEGVNDKEATVVGGGIPLRHGLLAVASAVYVGAMTCSNEAVPYVSYPVMVLAKSCKLIPTMLVGQIVERRLYSSREWLAAFLISLGIVMFHSSRMQSQQSSSPDMGLYRDSQSRGTILLCVSLALDGILSSCQNFLKVGKPNYRIPSAIETMLWMNLYATLFLLPVVVISGQGGHGLRLLFEKQQQQQQPQHDSVEEIPEYLYLKLALLNATVALGQIFIFLTITWYTPLLTTTITTTRKFFTILLSVWTFHHAFTTFQWVSVGLVFSGLYLTIFLMQSTATSNNDAKSTKKTQ